MATANEGKRELNLFFSDPPPSPDTIDIKFAGWDSQGSGEVKPAYIVFGAGFSQLSSPLGLTVGEVR